MEIAQQSGDAQGSELNLTRVPTSDNLVKFEKRGWRDSTIGWALPLHMTQI